ncbi:MAG: hypothetical protein HYZ39_16625 [Mycolicibacterium cosmeticum]|nr:hypothetical protein [Mycolicibacterium cosmeticum]
MTLLSLRTALLGATGAAMVAGVVACSSDAAQSDSTVAEPSATSTSQSQSGDRQAFRDCMTQHGVTMPEHGPGGGHGEHGPGPEGRPDGPPPGGAPGAGQAPPAPPGVDQGTWDSAHQACASLAPAHPPQQ